MKKGNEKWNEKKSKKSCFGLKVKCFLASIGIKDRLGNSTGLRVTDVPMFTGKGWSSSEHWERCKEYRLVSQLRPY